MPISLLHPDTTDIFYETTPDDDEVLIAGSDDDYDEIQRAAKQRRVEEYGQRYLRGERLFIQTAGLRGPFEGKWRNPWRRVKDTKHTGNGSKGLGDNLGHNRGLGRQKRSYSWHSRDSGLGESIDGSMVRESRSSTRLHSKDVPGITDVIPGDGSSARLVRETTEQRPPSGDAAHSKIMKRPIREWVANTSAAKILGQTSSSRTIFAELDHKVDDTQFLRSRVARQAIPSTTAQVPKGEYPSALKRNPWSQLVQGEEIKEEVTDKHPVPPFGPYPKLGILKFRKVKQRKHGHFLGSKRSATEPPIGKNETNCVDNTSGTLCDRMLAARRASVSRRSGAAFKPKRRQKGTTGKLKHQVIYSDPIGWPFQHEEGKHSNVSRSFETQNWDPASDLFLVYDVGPQISAHAAASEDKPLRSSMRSHISLGRNLAKQNSSTQEAAADAQKDFLADISPISPAQAHFSLPPHNRGQPSTPVRTSSRSSTPHDLGGVTPFSNLVFPDPDEEKEGSSPCPSRLASPTRGEKAMKRISFAAEPASTPLAEEVNGCCNSMPTSPRHVLKAMTANPSQRRRGGLKKLPRERKGCEKAQKPRPEKVFSSDVDDAVEGAASFLDTWDVQAEMGHLFGS